jgi:hypothetical protein
MTNDELARSYFRRAAEQANALRMLSALPPVPAIGGD